MFFKNNKHPNFRKSQPDDINLEPNLVYSSGQWISKTYQECFISAGQFIVKAKRKGSIRTNELDCFKTFVCVLFFSEAEISIQQKKVFIGFRWNKFGEKRLGCDEPKIFEPRAMVSILAQTLPEPVETTFETTFLLMSFQDIPLYRTSPTLRPSLNPTLSPGFNLLELQRTYQKQIESGEKVVT